MRITCTTNATKVNQAANANHSSAQLAGDDPEEQVPFTVAMTGRV